MVAAVRCSAVIHIAVGLGFGLGSVPTLLHFAAQGELPVSPFGFRSMSGPFEELGPERFLLLGWTFVGMCAVDVLAGIWLWQGRRRGLALGLAVDPPLFGLGLGFALPFLLLAVPIRATLALAGRGSLR